MILKVAKLGHPVLRAKAKAIPPDKVRSAEVQRLIDDMIDTLFEYDGVGLAAPQVHVSARLVLALEPAREASEGKKEAPGRLHILLNPEFLERSEAVETGWEGCLSVPDLRGLVTRPRGVRVRCLDRDGKKREFAVEGFFARVLQHECDHLDGKVFLDRMSGLESLTFNSEFGRHEPAPDDA
ncbi:MAG: peptide deformylase [Elusimicrobiota bacterium]|jgi:peptide deformylase